MIILKEQKTQTLKESPKTMSSSKVKTAAEKVFNAAQDTVLYRPSRISNMEFLKTEDIILINSKLIGVLPPSNILS